MKKLSVILVASLCVLGWGSVGLSEEKDDKAVVYATQNRVFHKYHEIGFFTGYIADDDFYNVFPVGMSYTFNKDYHLAWEVVRGEYHITREKNLKTTLETEFDVTPSDFTKPKYAVYSNFIWKPFYGKEAFLNKRVLNHESYFILGGGIAVEERRRPYEESEDKNIKVVSIGFGTRYFLGKHLCANLEIRDLIKLKEDERLNTIYFGITLGYRFNLMPRSVTEDQTIRKIKDYLNTHQSEKNEK